MRKKLIFNLLAKPDRMEQKILSSNFSYKVLTRKEDKVKKSYISKTIDTNSNFNLVFLKQNFSNEKLPK